jgi:heme a synthase
VAYVVLAAALWHAVSLFRSPIDGAIRRSGVLLAGAVLAQASLGILTLLWAVPLGLGIVHQVGGALVLAAAVRHLFIMRIAASS